MLTWDANTNPEVSGYKMYYGTSSGQYTNTLDVGNVTNCTVSDLEAGKTYYFAATAYDSNGSESSFSNEVFQDIDKLDIDADGMPDVWELEYFGTLERTGTDDYDGDGILDIDEYLNGSSPLDRISNPSLPLLETGEVGVDHNWIRVELNKSFSDPVVVAKPFYRNGEDPVVVRIRNVDSTGFEICILEWDYLDGIHAVGTVNYIVMERGSYILNDGTRIEAGRFETDKARSFETLSFGHAFQEAPVLMAAISSFNESDTVTGRLRNVSTQGFDFQMQEQELNAQKHKAEIISYIAWEPSWGTVGGVTFEIGKTEDAVRHSFQTLQFGQSFMNAPVFLADMQTADGKDTANVGWQNKDAYSVEIMIHEEQSQDDETKHTTEVVGYMAFDIVD